MKNEDEILDTINKGHEPKNQDKRKFVRSELKHHQSVQSILNNKNKILKQQPQPLSLFSKCVSTCK